MHGIALDGAYHIEESVVIKGAVVRQWTLVVDSQD